ncbi:hypothetical protein GCM10011348_18690 [Marinobacterium nitratireducens]|uniref:Uncharacterized protein n=1 Tax=Marinobacterium nitratireducens TaxID=518897 RepID=A0A918DT19_9GAMM|nr:hypothetical protein [Marinobacterium nitratireducens]GGO80909.1 hypothetical protein GCM10011348_18690 [Marinobacterium nitratireducens]
MSKSLLKKVVGPLLVTLIIAVGAFSGVFDADAEESVEAALKRSLVTFGVARSLNAVISVAQGTEVSVTPMGMGVTLAPGEVLDPLNDLVERFSGFMLVSSVALGTQKVLLEISSWLPYSVFLVAIGLAAVASRMMPGAVPGYWKQYLWKAFWMLAILRFLLPVALVGSEWMYSGFLQSRHIEAEKGITQASQSVQSINEERGVSLSDESDEGAWNAVKSWAGDARNRAASAVDIERYSEALKETAKDTIELIVVFFLSTFLFPVAIALAFWKLAKWSFTRPPVTQAPGRAGD